MCDLYAIATGLWLRELDIASGTNVYRKVVIIMTHENTEIVVAHQEIDLKREAKKQLRIAAVDSAQCVRKPAKDFTTCAVDYLINLFIDWVDSKLSA